MVIFGLRPRKPSTAYLVTFLSTLEVALPLAEGKHHSLTTDGKGNLLLRAAMPRAIAKCTIERFGSDPVDDAQQVAEQMAETVRRSLEGS